MEIPFELSIFSWIYEIGRWIVLTLLLAGLLCCFILPLWRKPVLLLFCVIFPLVFGAINFGVTWCGFHYRMELRDRYARDKSGWTDSFTKYPVNINLMPPEIRREYAKHDYHPRRRNLTGAVVAIPVLSMLMFLISGGVWLILLGMNGITGWFRKRKNVRQDRS
ncbi:MAG: hypothetical protein IJS14_03105 [Lentisphaeria bacterium]|nr:hypothetical protein [Lentisphaeria bacterium]